MLLFMVDRAHKHNALEQCLNIKEGALGKKYRVVAEEFAVATVTVFPVLLIVGRGSTGATLRAAVLIISFFKLTGRSVTQRPIGQLVPFTCLVPAQTEQYNFRHKLS